MIGLWEEKLFLLLSLAPKRVDQATPLISFYLRNENDEGVKRVCNFIEKTNYVQGFCFLALGSIDIKNGSLDKGLYLIKKANDLGVLDTKEVDEETANYLKKLIKEYFE